VRPEMVVEVMRPNRRLAAPRTRLAPYGADQRSESGLSQTAGRASEDQLARRARCNSSGSRRGVQGRGGPISAIVLNVGVTFQ
jgi:hypothetical protein